VAGLHTLLPEPAEELLSAVAAEVEPADAFIAPFTPVMVAHTGPGLAGLAWWWERPGFLAEAAGTTGGGQTAGR
jgi:fatty acid-binding protein DegV